MKVSEKSRDVIIHSLIADYTSQGAHPDWEYMSAARESHVAAVWSQTRTLESHERTILSLLLSELYFLRGSLSRAQGLIDQSLELARRLAEREPDNTRWQRDVSVSLERLEDVLGEQGNPQGERRAYEQCGHCCGHSSSRSACWLILLSLALLTGCTGGGGPGGGPGDGGVDPECRAATECPGTDSPCRVRTCIDGACGFKDAVEGTSCSDGNPCNGAETCAAGACVAGAPLDCDDHNACTVDTCGASGCLNTAQPDGAPAGGGSACATGAAGICGEGTSQCLSGVLSCVALHTPTSDANCNGLDDDCDGEIDEAAAVGDCLKTVNLVVLYDGAFARVARNPTKTIANAFASANALFAQSSSASGPAAFVPRVALKLGAQVSWANAIPAGMSYPPSSDPIDGAMLLASLQGWVAQRRNALSTVAGSGADHVILLTGHAVTGSAAQASAGTMCGTSSASVVSVPQSRSESELGASMAQVLGRSFNMPLDPAGSGTVMDPSRPSGSMVQPFSSASASALGDWFVSTYATGGVPRCLQEQPMADWTSVRCGDGRKQAAEECDAGVDVSDSCCTSACTLAPGCACSNTEPCCANGAILAGGTKVCRPSFNPACDVAETCNGAISDCPFDTVQPYGTACTDSGGWSSYCYQGRCAESRTTSCRSINGGQYPTSTGCDSSTSCTQLVCGTPQAGTCGLTWMVPPVGGTPCGGSANPTSSVCVSNTCVLASSLREYAWVTLAWSACNNGTQTRTVYCSDRGGPNAVNPSLCEGPAPASTRSCR